MVAQRVAFLGDPPGNHDRILDFSTAVTGGLFFCPAAEFLEDLPAPRRAVNVEAGEEPVDGRSTTPGDGSLGIGTLRRSSTR